MKKQMKPAVAQSKRTVRNVSEKFYVDICRRVTEAILLTGGDEELAEVAMGVINAYISCGIEPTDDMYVGLRLVFAVLKPELDRAMSRSRKARERARLRRKSDSPAESPAAAEPASPSQPAAPRTSSSASAPQTHSSSPTDSSSPSQSSPRLSRRARRELERRLRTKPQKISCLRW